MYGKDTNKWTKKWRNLQVLLSPIQHFSAMRSRGNEKWPVRTSHVFFPVPYRYSFTLSGSTMGIFFWSFILAKPPSMLRRLW
jgi:hypothetical protein